MSERLTAEQRKSIYEYRKRRREAKKNNDTYNPHESRFGNTVITLKEEAFPASYKYFKLIEEIADSEWFALEELERFKEHCEQVHHKNAEDACRHDGCLEDFTMEDSKEFAETLVKVVERYFNEN